MNYQRPKGTEDILPGSSEKWQYVEAAAREVFGRYQFSEIRTPLFEHYEVFARSVGDTSDIVTKEMYDFHDKGDRHITLRPEGTAGVVRAYVENKLFGPEYQNPYKVYYMGPMYRYERPQAGRLREFHQIGVEAFGAENPALDVEIMAMAINLLHEISISNVKLVINTLGDLETRKAYRDALVGYLEPHFDELSEDSQLRLHKNPLRVLDSKDAKDKQFVAAAPSILDYLSETAKGHFEEVKAGLDAIGVSYEVDASMVRGLDYYNHTIFEIMSDSKAFKGNWTTVIAGGRYNGLVEELGGPNTPGFGFGLGVERLLLLLDTEVDSIPVVNEVDVYVVGLGADTNMATLLVTQAIRQAGFSADRDFMDRKAKAQFKSANKEGAKIVITIGETELMNQEVNFKVMATGEQITLPIAQVEKDFTDLFQKYILDAVKEEDE